MQEEKPTRREKCKKFFKDNLLTILLITSIVLGGACGVIVRSQVNLKPSEAKLISFPGELLIRIIKCSATPLIIACVVVALGSLKLSVARTLCWQLIVLIVVTKIISALIGFLAVYIIRPGYYGTLPKQEGDLEERHIVVEDIFLDLFRNIFTNNMIGMYIQQYQTNLVPPEGNEETANLHLWTITWTYIGGMNLLGIMCIALGIGVALSIMEDRGSGLLVPTSQASKIAMYVATWILWISPLFLFFLILGEILGIQDIESFLSTWGMFLVTTHAGLIVVGFVEFPLVLYILTRQNPFKLYKDVLPALLTSYATASSLGTMPLVIEGLVKHGLDERLVRFVVPVGISINKDGATCFLVVATIFVAQMLNVELSVGHYFTILILAMMGSIAAAAVPFSGVVVLVMILNGVGLKQTLVAGILAVDVLNDRACTFNNILGNCVLPKVLAKWNKDAFGELKAEEDAKEKDQPA